MKREVFLLLISVLFFFMGTFAFSQNIGTSIIQAEHFTIEDGLSHRNVKGICQDQRGMMWFGTAYGLNRFDGYEFKWFTVEKNGLASNDIQHIHLGPEGNIWVFSGLENDRVIDIIDPITESVRSFAEVFGDEGRFLSDNISFTAGPYGQFAFLMPGKIVVYDGRFTETPLMGGAIEKGKVLFGKDGLWLWVEEAYGEKKNRLLQINENGVVQEHVFPESTFMDFYEVKENGGIRLLNFHFDTSNDKPYQRFYEIDATGKMTRDTVAEGLFDPHDIHIVYLRDFIRKIRSNYWAKSNSNGFWIVPSDPSGSSLLLSETYPELQTANFAFVDKKGAVWVSTEFGVFSFQFKENQFRNFLSQGVGISGFPMRGLTTTGGGNEKTLWGMVENRGELWKVDLTTGKEMLSKSDNGTTRWALDKAEDDELLFVSKKGIVQMDARTDKTTKIYPHDFLDVTTSTWKIHLDKYGKLWFDRANDGTLFVNNHGNLDTLPEWTGSVGEAFLYQFIENKTDTAWLVTNKGLFQLDIKNKKVVERYWREGQGRNHLPFDNVHHIWRGPDHFWLATANTGLVKWHPDRGVIKRYTRADGLSNNSLYAAYPDDYGNIWLPSDYGINVLDEATGRIRTYTTKDGICHNEFNRISHCRDEEGYLYFGTLDGVTTFHPKDFVTDTTQFQPPMAITSFQQFDGKKGKLVDKTAELIQTNSITLQPDDPLIRMSFALLTYEQLENVQYAYLIEGVDKDWIYQKENILQLGRLPYGEHLLRIKGQAANGQWSAEELRIRIHAVRPFYLQAWFFILMLLVVVGAILLFTRYREKSLREQRAQLEQTVKARTATIEQQKEKLRQLDAAKSHFFANISHELRTPLTLILGPVKTLLKGQHAPQKQVTLLNMALQNGEQLGRLVNEILDLRKMEMGKMELNVQPTGLRSFFNRYVSQFESLAASSSIDFSSETSLENDVTALLDREKCRQLLHNLLSNAFKFTPAGGAVRVKIQIRNEGRGMRDESGASSLIPRPSFLSITVSDTGAGIHPDDLPHVFDRFYQTSRPDKTAQGGTGIGLALCKEYAQLFGGKMEVESQLGKGSVFRAVFPVTLSESTAEAEAESFKSVPVFQPPATPENAVSTKPAGDTRPTILVVEDNPELQAYIRFILAEKYHVITAGNGKEALELLRDEERGMRNESRDEERGMRDDTRDSLIPHSSSLIPHSSSLIPHPSSLIPDLILSDLMMPVMDGYQFLEKLKSGDATRHIPVIMLTARAEAKDRLRALRIGVDDYLTKPFDEEELLVRIENLLANQAVRKVAAAEEQPAAEAPEVSQPDREWLENFETYIRDKLSNDALTISFLAQEFAMSDSTLLRQVTRLTGLSPKQYLQEVRLDAARQMLENRAYRSVSRVAAEAGFSNIGTFSRSFSKRFGKSPGECLND